MNKKVKAPAKNRFLKLRINDADYDFIAAKAKDAGYTNVSAFVRDYIARVKPKTKISPDILAVHKELMKVVALLEGKANREEVSRAVLEAAQVNFKGLPA